LRRPRAACRDRVRRDDARVDRAERLLDAPGVGAGGREDGWLDAGEIYSMRLSSGLVVLSGCETSRGQTLSWGGRAQPRAGVSPRGLPIGGGDALGHRRAGHRDADAALLRSPRREWLARRGPAPGQNARPSRQAWRLGSGPHSFRSSTCTWRWLSPSSGRQDGRWRSGSD